jgi:hypothetical protein
MKTSPNTTPSAPLPEIQITAWTVVKLIVIGTVAGLLLAEVGLRAYGYAYPRTAQRDDHLGTARIPGVEFIFRDEGFSHVRINSAGFRDEEWAVEKPRDTVRIAVLGDSYVEALQVEEDERFTETVERLLNASPVARGRRFQVMNFGVSGYGTAQELMCLRHYVWQYSPDLVVVGILTGNDVRNNSKALEKDAGRPYFQYAGDDLVLDTSFRSTPEHNKGLWYPPLMFLTDRSRLLQVAWQMRSWATSNERRRELTQGATPQVGDEIGLTAWVYAEPKDAARHEAWRVTEGILKTMSGEVEARGAAFLAVTLSSAIQVHPDPTLRAEFMQRNNLPDLFYPEHRIRAAGLRDGYSVLTLAPELQAVAQDKKMHLHGFEPQPGFGHWNANGHREAGQRIASALEALWHGNSGQDR